MLITKHTQIHGIWRHIRSKQTYKVIGIGNSICNNICKDVVNPYTVCSEVVIYKQLYKSHLKNGQFTILHDHMFVRPTDDFLYNFIKV